MRTPIFYCASCGVLYLDPVPDTAARIFVTTSSEVKRGLCSAHRGIRG